MSIARDAELNGSFSDASRESRVMELERALKLSRNRNVELEKENAEMASNLKRVYRLVRSFASSADPRTPTENLETESLMEEIESILPSMKSKLFQLQLELEAKTKEANNLTDENRSLNIKLKLLERLEHEVSTMAKKEVFTFQNKLQSMDEEKKLNEAKALSLVSDLKKIELKLKEKESEIQNLVEMKVETIQNLSNSLEDMRERHKKLAATVKNLTSNPQQAEKSAPNFKLPENFKNWIPEPLANVFH